jgi:hypothetical protein
VLDTLAHTAPEGFFRKAATEKNSFSQIVRILEKKDEEDTVEEKANEQLLINNLECSF